MYHFLSRVFDRISDAIRVFALLIIGVVMLFVGLMLALGGRPEALIPLILGSLAVFNLRKLLLQLYRDVTGSF
jgi:hypothetical protein